MSGFVQQLGRDHFYAPLHLLDHAWREDLVHQRAQPSVIGIIYHDHAVHQRIDDAGHHVDFYFGRLARRLDFATLIGEARIFEDGHHIIVTGHQQAWVRLFFGHAKRRNRLLCTKLGIDGVGVLLEFTRVIAECHADVITPCVPPFVIY